MPSPLLFGWPDVLVNIHFPQDSPGAATTWYWYYPVQTPNYFSYLGGVWGPGWVCQPTFSVIKILAIDTVPIVAAPAVGFKNLEDAALHGTPDSTFGRFNFTDQWFWDVAGIDKPFFEQNSKGIIYDPVTHKTSTLQKKVTQAVQTWAGKWNSLAAQFNADTVAVDPGSAHYAYPSSPFGSENFPIPLPEPNISISQFAREFANHDIYLGPVPGTEIFRTGFAMITKQGYAFKIAIGKLNPHTWDMSKYPPRFNGGEPDVSTFGVHPSAGTGDFGGFSPNVNFPQSGPIIV